MAILNSLKTRFDEVHKRFSALAKRERLLILAGVWAAVVMLSDYFFVQPALRQVEELKQQYAIENENHMSIQREMQEKEILATADINLPVRNRINSLRASKLNIESQLKDKVADMIDPVTMRQVLHLIFTQQQGLKLVEVKNQKASEITVKERLVEESESGQKTEIIQERGLGMFIHPVTLEFEGEYAEVLKFVTNLEALPWKFYWHAMEYEVVRYPKATITLNISTLSDKKNVLGI